MKKLLELLLPVLLPTVKAAGTGELVKVFDKFHEKDPVKHSASLRAAYIGLVVLVPIVEETKTEFDDTGIDLVLDAIRLSASKYGVQLDNTGLDS